ncbi:hypothetical protein AAMO2058_000717900 [Amorphochlora amoebiformis]|mmetsp:Transcript_10992/g.17357  ORF Transcript_10992/g.17357 Transcript_10992/m.17357 type:complete len:1893 (-) Transcript_10992:80-5758(-)
MSRNWEPVNRKGIAKFDFVPNGEFQLALTVCQKVKVESKRDGWYKGTTLMPDGSEPRGIFPESYIKLRNQEARQSVVDVVSSKTKWKPIEKVGKVLYSFKADGKFQLGLEPGQEVMVLCESNGWYKGYLTSSDKKSKGFFPVTYVLLQSDSKSPTTRAAPPSPPRRTRKEEVGDTEKTSNRQSTFSEFSSRASAHHSIKSTVDMAAMENNMTLQALLGEIDLCMGLWLDEANDALVDGRVTDYQRVQERITTLLELRSQLMDIPPEDMAMDFPPLRRHIIQLIEKSRKMVVGFMVPRNDKGMLADTSNTSVMDLLRLHHEMYQPGDDLAQHFSFRERQRRRKSTVIELKRSLHKNLHSVVETINSALGRKPEIDLFQLVLECSMVITTIKEDFHLNFALWNKKTKTPITEEWSLTFSSLGMARDVLKNKTIFSDLTIQDLEDDIYLVIKVYRHGALLLDKAPTTLSAAARSSDGKHRRPFFVSMASLRDIGYEKFVEKEFTPHREFQIRAPAQEAMFSSMPRRWLDGKIMGGKPVLEAKQVVINLCLRNGTVEQTLKRNDGELEGVVVSRKLYFPPVFNPDEERNDLFLWITTGKFDQGNKKSPINCFLSVKVFADGKQIPRAIKGCGNPDPQDEYMTSVYYHSNSPPWDEILSLKIEPNLLDKAHVQFVVYHASTNRKSATPLSFGWLDLTTERKAVIQDKEHTIRTYKISSNLKELRMCKYKHIGGRKNLKLRGKGEEIRVRTKLLSTIKTQSDVLLPLLNWSEISQQQIQHYLKQFVNTPYSSEQTKRYVKVVMDLLFSMLQKKSYSSVHELALKALIHIFSNMLKEEQSMLKMYMDNVFKFHEVHTALLSLSTSFLKTELRESGKGLVSFTKSFHWLMDFTVRSFNLDSAKTVSLAEFKRGVEAILDLVKELLSRNVQDKKIKNNSNVAAGQACMIRILPVVMFSLGQVFSGNEHATNVVGLVRAISDEKSNDVPRLNLVRVLSEDMAFRRDAQEAFFPLLLDNFKNHMVPSEHGSDECFVTMQIFKKLIKFIEQSSSQEIDEKGDTKNSKNLYELRNSSDAADILRRFLPMLPELVHTSLILLKAKENPALLPKPSQAITRLSGGNGQHLSMDAIVCTVTFFKILPEGTITSWVQGLKTNVQFDLLRRLLELWLLALRINIFSEVWVIFVTLQIQVICKVHALLTPLISRMAAAEGSNSLTLGASETQVIELYFKLGIELLSHQDLKVEDMNKKRRRLVQRQLGEDLREGVRKSLTALWKSLGDRRPIFTRELLPGLFGIIATRLSSDGKGIEEKVGASQKMCMDMYYSMITTEYRVSKKLNKVERYTIDNLSQIIHESQGRGDLFFEMIEKDLQERFDADPPNQKEPGEVFLKSVSHLFGLMSSLLKFPTTAIYEDERTSMALALMEYLSKKDERGNIRREMYFRYVQYLVDLHAELKNYQEAGIVQLLEVDMLRWSEDIVEARGDFPREAERDRKERLYQNANSFFTSGQDWERAIAMCEKLEKYYRHDVCDYHRLADVLKQEAQLFSKIVDSPRFFSSYYRVLFKGDFADEDDGSEYVYRGGRMEKVMNFSQRIKRKYPSAKMIMRWDPKPKELEESKQLIAIVTLKLPSWDVIVDKRLASAEEVKAYAKLSGNPRVKEQVLEYFHNNRRSVFLYEKPEQKAKEKKPANEFKDLWVRQHFLSVDTPFPTVRRRIKVCSRREFMLTPIENATAIVLEKNTQIKKEIEQVRRAANLQPVANNRNGSTEIQNRSENHLVVPTLRTPAATPRLTSGTGSGSSIGEEKVQVNRLLSLLQGTIDAAVNGGTKLFCEAFLSAEGRSAQGDEKVSERVEIMQKMLKEQVVVLKAGLALFGRVCPEEYFPLLKHLMTTYDRMSKSMEKYYNSG